MHRRAENEFGAIVRKTPAQTNHDKGSSDFFFFLKGGNVGGPMLAPCRKQTTVTRGSYLTCVRMCQSPTARGPTGKGRHRRPGLPQLHTWRTLISAHNMDCSSPPPGGQPCPCRRNRQGSGPRQMRRHEPRGRKAVSWYPQ